MKVLCLTLTDKTVAKKQSLMARKITKREFKMSYHDEFKAGFLAGYASVKGTGHIPTIPATPPLPVGCNYYDLGYRYGQKAAQK